MSCGPSWPAGRVTRRSVLELIGGVVLVAMIPENPVVGGTVLQRAAIRSPNFVTGSTGWSVNQDGSAEFNNIVIRGGQIISGTALFYSGPPALGNLVESIAAVGGTDVKGNLYLSGTASYAGAGTLASSIQGNVINFFSAPGPGGPWTQVAQISPGSGDLILASNRHIVAQQLLTALTGASITGGLTTDTEVITSGQAGGLLQQITNTTGGATATLCRWIVQAAGDGWLGLRVAGDTQNRITADTTAGGLARIQMGPGNAALDITIERNAQADLLLNPGRAVQVASPVALNNIAAPNAIAANTQVFSDANGKLAQLPPAGQVMQVPGAKLATFPNITVTQAALTTLASDTYQGGDAEAGSVYELEVNGNGTTGSTLQALQLGILFGGVTMAPTFTFGTTALNQVSTAFRWWARVRVICHTAGAAGTWSSEILATVAEFGAGNIAPGNNNFATAVACEAGTTSTVDSTANQTLALRAAWGATTGAPTLTSRVALFKRVA